MSQTPSSYLPPTHFGTTDRPHGALTSDDRNLGAIAHITPLILMLVSGGLAGFIGSLVVYLYAKDRSPGARQYAATALNVQITVAIASAISYVLMLVLIGFVTLPVVLVLGVIAHVVGAIKASNGEVFTPPITPRFVS